MKNVLFKPSRTGLGDRLRALACAALYAEHTDRRLLVDWRDGLYGPVGQNIFGRLFSLEHVDFQTAWGPLNDDIDPPAWRGRTERSLAEVYDEDGWKLWDRDAVISEYQTNCERLSSAETVVIWEFTRTRQFAGLFALNSAYRGTVDIEAFAIKRYIRFQKEVNCAVDELLRDACRPIVGVHVRKTAEFASDKLVDVDLASCYRQTDAMLGRLGGGTIFLATDNKKVLNAFRNRYGQRGIRLFFFEKWLPQAGEPLHLNHECPDRFEMALSAVFDLCGLTKCDVLVTTRASSFSIVASAMSGKPTVVMDRQSSLTDVRFYRSVSRVCRNLLSTLRNPRWG